MVLKSGSFGVIQTIRRQSVIDQINKINCEEEEEYQKTTIGIAPAFVCLSVE